MSETEQIPAARGSELDELRSQVQSLQGTLSFALVLMFIFTVCVNIFLFRQAKAAGMEARNTEALINNYINGGEAQARDFWTKLVAYSTTHPDFAPVMNKYSQFITVHTNAPAAMPPKK